MKILFAALLISHLANAQHKWNDGVAVLNDSQVIVGKISFNHTVLLAKQEDQVIVLPSHKIYSFRFYDAESNINRHYVSLPSYGSIFRTLYFYEVVVWGKTSVIRKQHNLINHQSKNGEADNFEYYVLLNEEMVPLKKFRSKVYPKLLSAYPFALEDLINQKKLNPNLPADAIRIIQFSNQHSQEISIAGL